MIGVAAYQNIGGSRQDGSPMRCRTQKLGRTVSMIEKAKELATGSAGAGKESDENMASGSSGDMFLDGGSGYSLKQF